MAGAGGGRVDLTAFELVDRMGLEQATSAVMGSYVDLSSGCGGFRSRRRPGRSRVRCCWRWRARKLGVVRCLLLLLFGWVFMGVLKEATPVTVLHGGMAAVILFTSWVAWPGGGSGEHDHAAGGTVRAWRRRLVR
jgi:hypothetical protein